MPVRNPDPRHFPSAIESLLNQSITDFDILVIEDAGERPGTQEPVRSVEKYLSRFQDSRIHHIKNLQPGIASARNRGLTEANTDLIAMLDADDRSQPDRLSIQCERMQAEPDLTVLGTQITIVNDDEVETGARRYPTTHDEIMRRMPIYNPLAQPSVMLRKDVVTAIGGYRDRTCEDYDLWSRLALAGARFANLDEALVSYRLHPGAMKSRKLRASLRDTLDIKQEYWRSRQSWRGQLRIFGERGLLLLPPKLVMAMFERMYMRQSALA